MPGGRLEGTLRPGFPHFTEGETQARELSARSSCLSISPSQIQNFEKLMVSGLFGGSGVWTPCQRMLGSGTGPIPKWRGQCSAWLVHLSLIAYLGKVIPWNEFHLSLQLSHEPVVQVTVVSENWWFFFFCDRLHDNSKSQRNAVTSSQSSCVRPSVVLWKSQSKLPSKNSHTLSPMVYDMLLNWFYMETWHLSGGAIHNALSDVLISAPFSNFRCRAERLN